MVHAKFIDHNQDEIVSLTDCNQDGSFKALTRKTIINKLGDILIAIRKGNKKADKGKIKDANQNTLLLAYYAGPSTAVNGFVNLKFSADA